MDLTETQTHYSRLWGANNAVQLKTVVADVLTRLNFDVFRFMPLTPPDTRAELTNFGDKERDAWPAENDAITRHAYLRNKPLFLSAVCQHIANSPFYAAEDEALLGTQEKLCECGIEDLYVMPGVTQFGVRTLLAVSKIHSDAHELRELVATHSNLLCWFTAMLNHITAVRHVRHFYKTRALRNAVLPITDKQLELLTILAKNNVTLGGAADKMCVSLDTANKHIAGAKSALDAKTQAAAVFRAVAAGLIDTNLQ